MHRLLTLSILIFLLLLVAVADVAAVSDQEAKMREVIDVLETFAQEPKESIPQEVLSKAKAIAIIPSVVKVGLVVGGRYGKGVVSIRKSKGGWSNPMFMSLSGGSIGWQVGAESADVMLVFMSPKSVENIVKGKFTLGADVSVAVGPIGGSLTSGDSQMGPEIYTYSRSRGLFAGIALDGARLKIEHKDNVRYYKIKELQPAQVIAGGGVVAPASSKKLHNLLNGYIE